MLRRLPALRFRRPERLPFLDDAARASYPAVAADFRQLDERLMPAFYEQDEAALRCQHEFWLGQVKLMLGAALATAMGAVHAALGGGVFELGIAQAVVTAYLTFVAQRVARRGAQAAFIDHRLRAERLRAQYFLYVTRAGRFAEGDPDAVLDGEVERICGPRVP